MLGGKSQRLGLNDDNNIKIAGDGFSGKKGPDVANVIDTDSGFGSDFQGIKRIDGMGNIGNIGDDKSVHMIVFYQQDC